MKILVVDDSFDWLNIHSATIQAMFNEDIELVSACSAAEALNIYIDEYKETPFNLVITDLQMEADYDPMYAGEWLIKEIQTINPNQLILIVSSMFNIDIIADNFGVEYLSKRFIVSDQSNYQFKLNELLS